MLRRARSTAQNFGSHDAQREAFRILRSNLLVAIADLQNPIVIVTSASPGEGKTSTCANLAQSMGQAGLRIVLVDLDLRHPDVHRWVRGHNEYGVSDVLLDRRPLEDCLQYIELGGSRGKRGLYLLATGGAVSNPTELLGSPRTARLLEALALEADLVLLDTPPVLPVADTLVIGRMAAGAVLVVEARSTPITAIEEAKAALTRNQTRLLGICLNKLSARDWPMGYGYGYGYGYGTTPNGDEAPAAEGNGSGT